MQGLLRAFYVITHMFSITLEVFLRHRFGERYLHSMHVMLPLGLAALYVFKGASLLGKQAPEAKQLILPATLFVVLSIWHLIVIQVRNKRGEEWHSKFSGDSWLYFAFYPIKQKTFQLFFEPAICFFIGYFLQGVHEFIAYWIMFASVCMFVKEIIEHILKQGPILDQRDSEFESGRKSSASQSVVALASFQPVQGMIGLKEYHNALPAALQSIIQGLPEIKYEKVEVKNSDQIQAPEDEEPRSWVGKFMHGFFNFSNEFILVARVVFWLPIITFVFGLFMFREGGADYIKVAFGVLNICISILGAILLMMSWIYKGKLPVESLEPHLAWDDTLGLNNYAIGGRLAFLLFWGFIAMGVASVLENVVLRGLMHIIVEILILYFVLRMASDTDDHLPLCLRIVTDNRDGRGHSIDKWLKDRTRWIKKINITLFLFNKILFALLFSLFLFLVIGLYDFYRGVNDLLFEPIKENSGPLVIFKFPILLAVSCLIILLVNKLVSYFYQENPAKSFWEDIGNLLGGIGFLGVIILFFIIANHIQENSFAEFVEVALEIVQKNKLLCAGIVVYVTFMILSFKLMNRARSNTLKLKQKRLEKYLEKHPNDAETRVELDAFLKEIK